VQHAASLINLTQALRGVTTMALLVFGQHGFRVLYRCCDVTLASPLSQPNFI